MPATWLYSTPRIGLVVKKCNCLLNIEQEKSGHHASHVVSDGDQQASSHQSEHLYNLKLALHFHFHQAPHHLANLNLSQHGTGLNGHKTADGSAPIFHEQSIIFINLNSCNPTLGNLPAITLLWVRERIMVYLVLMDTTDEAYFYLSISL